MNRRAWLLLAVVAVLSLALGTSGFSAASIDRGVQVSTVDHEDAFLGLADPGADGSDAPSWAPQDMVNSEDPVTEEDPYVTLFVAANRFGNPGLSLSVYAHRTTADGVTVSNIGPVTLGPGEVAPVFGHVDCGSREGQSHHTVPLTVVATSTDGSVHAEIEYEVGIVCASGGDASSGGDDAGKYGPEKPFPPASVN